MVKAAPNSVDWVAEGASYLEWTRKPEVHMLHVSGPPGSGITVLASHVVKLALEERKYRDTTVLRFVFDKHSAQARTPESALVSLCHQLLLARPWLFRLVRPLCEFLLEQGMFTRKVMWPLLRSLLQHAAGGSATTYCALYAVHECEEPLEELIVGLGGIALVKTLVTTDDVYASQKHAWSDSSSSRRIRWRGEDGRWDVQAVARANVDRIAREKPLWTELKEDIVEALCAPPRSHLTAMHRLVLLQWSDDGQSTRAALRKRLDGVIRSTRTSTCTSNDDIDAAPDAAPTAAPTLEAWPWHEHVRDMWVLSALRWAMHAVRPLATTELAVAVALEELGVPSTTSEGRQRLLAHVSRDLVSDLLRKAPPLVQLVGNCVVPVHRRLRASLYGHDDTRAGHFSDPHYAILTSCLEYLKWATLDHHHHRRHHNHDLSDGIVLQGALVDYASAHWPEHYRHVAASNKLEADSSVRDFLADADHFDRWARLYREHERPLPDEPGCLGSPTQAICHLGYEDMLDLSAFRGEVLADHREDLRLALDHAVQGGHAKVVALLLDVGARSDRAIRLAARCGRNDLIDALLDIDPGGLAQAGEGGYTALHHAACHGHETSVELLVRRNAELLNVCTADGSSALCLATKSGQVSVVTSLVRLGADWATKDTSGYDALHLAARGGFSDIIDVLLPLGADPHLKGGPNDNTAVHLAVRFHHLMTLRKLLHSTRDTGLQNSKSYTPLHVAAKEGFLPIIQALIEAAAKAPTVEGRVESEEGGVEQKDYSSQPLILAPIGPATPLQLAVKRGHVEAVKMLLAHRVFRDKADCNQALFMATAEGLDEVVHEIMAHGVSLDAEDTYGNTLLHEAVRGNHIKVLLELLDRERAKMDKPNHDSATPLHVAAEMGSLAMVYNLLDHGANPDPKTREGNTPLHLAAHRGHRLVVRELQKHTKTIDHKNKAKDTALALAIGGGHTAIVKDLLRASNGDEVKFPFHHRAILEQETVLRALLESGDWDCNMSAEHHLQTPLQVAIKHDLLSAVKLLLSHNADVHAKATYSVNGQTPLHMAARRGATNIVDLLLGHGADIGQADKNGQTPLFAASQAGHVDTVKRLLANVPQDIVNQPDRRGWTALFVSATQNAEIARMLLEAHASPNIETYTSKLTPLARAAFNDSRVEVVRHLLAAKADPNRPDADGETAVHRAAIGGSVEIMKLLIRAKANINTQRTDGYTPLQLAIINKKSKVAELLFDQPSISANIFTEKNGIVLMKAAQTGFTGIVERLLKNDSGDNRVEGVPHAVLVDAVKGGDELMVKLLLDHGAQVRVPGEPDSNVLFTVLYNFGSSGLAIFKRLLDTDADAMNDVNSKGDSVLRVAVARGVERVVEHLVDRDANTNQEKGGKEDLALSVARSGPWQTVAALLKLKSSPQSPSNKDRFGRGPLAVAIHAGNKVVAQNLVGEEVVDVNHQDHAGRTPLISSVLKLGSLVPVLLAVHGIRINVQDTEGKTALIHACILNDSESVRQLLDAKADTTVVDCRNRGPLYWACRMGSMDVFEQVLRKVQDEGQSSDYSSQRDAALCAAVASNKPTFVEILLGPDNDIPWSLPFDDGWTPLYTAQQYKLAWAESRLQNAYFTADKKQPVRLPSAWSNSDKTVNLKNHPDTNCITALGKSRLTDWFSMR